MPVLELVNTIATTATAIIAMSALNAWKQQERGKRKADFLDDLLDKFHEFESELEKCLKLYESIRFGIKSHTDEFVERNNTPKSRAAGAIDYINTYGKKDAITLNALIDCTKTPLAQLRTHDLKGEIYHFSNYKKCQEAIFKLIACFRLIQFDAMIISDVDMDHNQSEIQSMLEKFLDRDTKMIADRAKDAIDSIYEFASLNYRRIFE